MMNLSTNEFDWIMRKIAEGFNKAKEVDDAYSRFKERLKCYTIPLFTTAFATALEDSEPIDDGSGDHRVNAVMNKEEPDLEECIALICRELRTRRDFEDRLREQFCLDPHKRVIEQLDQWWTDALRASTVADGTNPEPCDSILTMDQVVKYPLTVLSNALNDAGFEDGECDATYQNIHELATELMHYRKATMLPQQQSTK